MEFQRKSPVVVFNKDVYISDKVYVPRSYNISKGLQEVGKLKEAVVDVDKGIVNKRINQLKELGFKIKNKTQYDESDSPYKRVWLYIKK